MSFVYGNDDICVAWAEARHPVRFRSDAVAIGRTNDAGELVAVVIFDTFSPTNCNVSVVSDGSRRWFDRRYATVCMAFPFNQCKFPRITAFVSTLNVESLAFSPRFGWVQEGVMRRAGAKGEDLIIYGMLREECLWLPPPAGAEAAREL